MNKHPRLTRPCDKCGALNWKLFKYRIASGALTFQYRCARCLATSDVFEKKINVVYGESLPEYTKEGKQKRICEVCSAEGAEWHHWAPFHIFGDEYDKWPMSLLCVSCHGKWHRLVTPNMGKRKDGEE